MAIEDGWELWGWLGAVGMAGSHCRSGQQSPTAALSGVSAGLVPTLPLLSSCCSLESN